MDAREFPLPPHIAHTLKQWASAQLGHYPGSFITAVLTNDLRTAVEKADGQNIFLIPAMVMWLFNHAPAACWGSPEKVELWYQQQTPVEGYPRGLKEEDQAGEVAQAVPDETVVQA
jgi:hypothetical protein